AVASPISRIPRRLFQLVLERVRMGMSTQMSFFFKAQVATLSARLTILPRVTLSRALRRLLPGVILFFAMRISFRYLAETQCEPRRHEVTKRFSTVEELFVSS